MKDNIKKDVLKKCLKHIERIPIEDGYYGTIDFLNHKFCNVKVNTDRRQHNDHKRKYKTIIVVLESPHKHEFLPIYQFPLVNDKQFNKYLANVLNLCHYKKKIRHKHFNIYLMNAIQYQCSLGLDPELYRDLVFLLFWETLHIDFENRLKSALKKKKIFMITNFVTEGSHKQIQKNGLRSCSYLKPYGKFKNFLVSIGCEYNCNSLNEIVQQSINLKAKKYIRITGNHPSSWRSKKNLKAELLS